MKKLTYITSAAITLGLVFSLVSTNSVYASRSENSDCHDRKVSAHVGEDIKVDVGNGEVKTQVGDGIKVNIGEGVNVNVGDGIKVSVGGDKDNCEDTSKNSTSKNSDCKDSWVSAIVGKIGVNISGDKCDHKHNHDKEQKQKDGHDQKDEKPTPTPTKKHQTPTPTPTKESENPKSSPTPTPQVLGEVDE